MYTLTRAGFIKRENQPWSHSLKLLSPKRLSDKNQLKLTSDGNYDARGKLIKNIGDAIDEKDVVNRAMLLNLLEINKNHIDGIINEKLLISEKSNQATLSRLEKSNQATQNVLVKSINQMLDNNYERINKMIMEKKNIKIKMIEHYDTYKIRKEFNIENICRHIYNLTGEIEILKDVTELYLLIIFENIDDPHIRIKYYRYIPKKYIIEQSSPKPSGLTPLRFENVITGFASIERDGHNHSQLVIRQSNFTKGELLIFDTMFVINN